MAGFGREVRRAILSSLRIPIRNTARIASHARREAAPVDVQAVMARFSAQQHVTRADAYFVREDEEAQLFRRPFQNDAETQQRLYGLSAVLQLLQLQTGSQVLDFGCGSGWLSRCLAYMGAEVVGVDVSAKALHLAEEWLSRDPIAAELRAEFRHFDSVRLPLADASVDRVVSFDAFHHVLDQAGTLAEMRRVLRPGGLAVFHEPGPEHSLTASAQHEMREYEVIENNIDVHAIRDAALQAGFTGMRLLLPQPQSPVFDIEEFSRVAEGRPSVREVYSVMQNAVNYSYNLRIFALNT